MPNSEKLRYLRKNYGISVLELEKMEADPYTEFKQWFSKALSCEEIDEANIMVLASSGENMQPSARIVLLKGFEPDGLIFYTNYKGRKGEQLAENPRASLLFFWGPLERQVRIEGKVEKVSPEASDEYFHSRPKGSQLGAIASEQSTEIPSRQVLEDRLSELEKKYANTDKIPRPEHWGGYTLKPHYWEFWQGRPNRLHDRIAYQLDGSGEWKMSRLAP
ncbi:MAG: pyridoxamine 5'-phosphate oxidase [Chitinophagales bacterium]